MEQAARSRVNRSSVNSPCGQAPGVPGAPIERRAALGDIRYASEGRRSSVTLRTPGFDARSIEHDETRHRSPIGRPRRCADPFRVVASRCSAIPPPDRPNGRHSLDALMDLGELNIVAAFGPQHGMRGDKQDNMVETEDAIDPRYGIPVFSLYGEVRYPTDAMLDTLRRAAGRPAGHRHPHLYLCHDAGLSDRCLRRGGQGHLGAGPTQPRRPPDRGQHPGAGLGELRRRGSAHHASRSDLRRAGASGSSPAAATTSISTSVAMDGYRPEAAPDFGWPVMELSWVNPSPNASSLNMARCFPGTVLLEGTTLSEGRGTTTSLEVVGAPGYRLRACARTHAHRMCGLDRGRTDPALLVRADLPQTRRPALLGAPDPHRQSRLPSRSLQALSTDRAAA